MRAPDPIWHSQRDPRKAVAILEFLRTPPGARASDREVARRFRASHPTVAKLRAEVENSIVEKLRPCPPISDETRMRQAHMTATEYLDAAIESIDFRFGSGFAKQHPQLVGAFMITAALDYGATSLARAEE